MLLVENNRDLKGEVIMYVKEAKWYQKQQKKRARGRRFGAFLTVIAGLFLIPLCFWTLQVCAMDVQKGTRITPVAALLTSSESVQSVLQKGRESLETVEAAANVQEAVGKIADTQAALAEISEITEMPEYTRVEDGRYLIVIDAGHGGEDEGCSFEQVEEKDINLKLALLLQQKLEKMDFQVFLTRSEDGQLSLEERVKLANGVGADAFISIHQNSCEDKSASGIETYYYASETVDNERLAKLVEQYVVLYTKARDRGIRTEENLYVIRECNMPSCLVETGFLSNPQERELLQEEGYLEKIAQGLAEAVQLYFYPKVMYLTFDDGPVAGNTEAVLDILKEKGIKATFFVVGKNVERNPELAKRIVEEGHTIGIHCYQHDYDVIYADVDSYLEDFEKAKQVVYDVTGVEAKLFRFPGGSINSYNKSVYKDIIEEMTARGYVYFDWNASFEDAVRGVTCEKILQNAKESTLGRKRVVMLAHDIVDATVECLEEVLEQFPEYELLPLDESVEPVQF